VTRSIVARLKLLGLATVFWACGGAVGDPVTIELSDEPVCHIADQLTALPSRGTGPEAELLQVDARPIDFHRRLPGEAALLFELPETLSPAAVRLSMASSQGQELLEPVREPGGGWRAQLPAPAGTVVRLRLENRSGEPVSWGRLRLTGVETRVGPPLAPPPDQPERRLSYLLYVVDALRADHLSVYGYDLPTSPRLQELAQSSTVFLQAYSTGAHTGTSIPSLLTSVVPSGVEGRLPASEDGVVHTAAELFREAGFETAAFQANFMLQDYLGYGRGFDTYEAPSRKIDGKPAAIDATELHERVFAWLERPREQPFFLFVQSMDVHSPYDPPPPFRGKFAADYRGPEPELTYFPEDLDPGLGQFFQSSVRQLEPEFYDDGIAYADHELGRLLDRLTELGLRDSTAIIITADHGESLGEGGRFLHGFSLNEELVHVPLLIALPWLTDPVRVDSPVSLLDLAPTLLDLAVIPVPAQFQGHSLLRSHPRHRPPVAVGERTGSQGFQEWFLREGDWKLIATHQGSRLFHIPSDRLETRDMSPEQPVLTRYMRERLWAASPAFRQTDYRPPSIDRQLDEEQREQLEEALRALGYIE